MSSSKAMKLILSIAVVAVAAFAALPASALAGSPVTGFEVIPSTTQAGGHPDVLVHIKAENRETQNIPAPTCDCQDPKDITVHLPAGFIGDPHAAPRCNAVDFGSGTCPADSQVGYLEIGLGGEELKWPENPEENVGNPGGFLGFPAVYNMIPKENEAALLAINIPILEFPIYTVLEARTDTDYGLDAKIFGINHIFPVHELKEHLWGVPAAPSHDFMRHFPGCDPSGFAEPSCYPGIPAVGEQQPFLDNPTTCGEPLATSVDVTSYDREVTHGDAEYPATTGCDQLTFNPSLFAQPTGKATETASGLDLDLQVPQFESPSVPSPSEIRASTVELPEGVTINPNAADGKTDCTDEDIKLGSRELAAACPEDSKVGTLSLESSALPGPLPGYVYLGEPKPGNPYRLVLAADGFGTHVKLVGSARANPSTGQLVVDFPELPQAPFSDFNMHFFGSERGLLVTPERCGTYPVKSTFTPWDSLLGMQRSEQFFSVQRGPDGGECPGATRPFKPGFEAGTIDKSAGKHAPFKLNITRNDGEQNLSGLTVNAPPGFSATLAGVSYCPEEDLTAMQNPMYAGAAELVSPKCPSSSQIGTAVTGAGAGSHPVYLPGNVYLAGPYKGAPLSLAVVTPAVSGPYDLGTVVVRAAIQVDPTDAHITAVSDAFPQILEGIPLRLRSVLIQLDRPGFTLNPTNCSPKMMSATIAGNEGGSETDSMRYQAAGCASLPFAPTLKLTLKGHSKRTQDPAIHAALSAREGDANISQTVVTLPRGEQVDQSHIGNICTKVQYAAANCPPSSQIGTATAVTPLLEKPLTGNVYLRSSNHGLPDLAVALRGQVDFDLIGRIDSVHEALRTSFQTVPDVPVSKFNLDLFGGQRGLIINGKDLCKSKAKAEIHMVGQNGRVSDSMTGLNPSCGKSSKRHKRHSRTGKAG